MVWVLEAMTPRSVIGVYCQSSLPAWIRSGGRCVVAYCCAGIFVQGREFGGVTWSCGEGEEREYRTSDRRQQGKRWGEITGVSHLLHPFDDDDKLFFKR